MIVIRPSRLTSPISVQTFDVPTSIPTRTASLSTFVVRASCSRLDEVAADQRHVVEDPEPEVDQCHEVQVEAEPITDEGEDDGHDRVRDEPADEDPIVVDAVELGPDGSEDRVERGKDGHGRIPRELEADVDVEDEPGKDAHEETRKG